MPSLVPLIPPTEDEFLSRTSVTLGGVPVQIILDWRDNPGAWYANVETDAGARVLSGVRVSPGGLVWREGQDPRLPPGNLYTDGPDPYDRLQLGGDVRLLYFEPGEGP